MWPVCASQRYCHTALGAVIVLLYPQSPDCNEKKVHAMLNSLIPHTTEKPLRQSKGASDCFIFTNHRYAPISQQAALDQIAEDTMY